MVTSVEERVSRLEGAYEQVDRRLDDLNQRLNELSQRVNTLLVLVCGSWVTTMAAIIGLYVKG